MVGFLSKYAKLLLQLLLVLGLCNRAAGQSLLDKPISVTAQQTRVADVLKEISAKGGFYFSYNGRLLPQDSLVTLSATDQPVSLLLHRLFKDRFAYEERKNYIIITPSLPALSFLNPDMTADGDNYVVSGFIIDARTGERLRNASVYDKDRLAATLSDEQGFFRLKLDKNEPAGIAITVSKQSYRDTAIHLLQPVLVSSRPDKKHNVNAPKQDNRVERTGLGRLLISSRQMIQSLNIPDFFATRPFQVSLTPGLSTHGMFSPQVVNKFSLNLAGGYTAGVNGLEIGGLFNINKGDARYVQLAGVFNLAGGSVTGLQLAGVHNRALDTVKGAQLSLFTNSAGERLSGVQISALHNHTRQLKGLQLGLVNVADSSAGASLGLLNIIGNGFYKITWSANDISNTNLSLKTGTHAFYSELLTSVNIAANKKFYALGLGIGHDFMASDRLYLSAEANYQIASTGLWDDRWTQGKLLVNARLTKHISLVAGPTFNHYNHSGQYIVGYENVTRSVYQDNDRSSGHQTRNWIGWEAGIAFHSVFKPVKHTVDLAQNWYLGIAATAGIGWDKPYGLVSGGELSLQRELGGQLTGTLSTGYTYFSVPENYLFGTHGGTDIYASPVKIIPLKAGIRLKAAGKLFFSGEVGEAFGEGQSRLFDDPARDRYNTSFHAFMYAVSAGFAFKSGLETGIKFADYGLESQYKQFALRLGYRLKLNK